MTVKQWLRTSCAALASVSTLHSGVARAQEYTLPSTHIVQPQPQVTPGHPASGRVAALASNVANETPLTRAAKLALLRKNIKYVFVLFQENRSFDQHFGTFPGADGLFSKPAIQTPGFSQPIVGTDGHVGAITPFLIPRAINDVNGNPVNLYPEDTDSVDHSHSGIVNAIHYKGGVTLNDRYALNEEGLTTDANGNIVALKTMAPPTANPTLLQKQRAELVMSHLDCDTVPFLWRYADRFTLLDNFHATVIAPSTPNAIALIAGQSGETQWALHPEQSSANTSNPGVARGGGEPVFADPGPFPGSALDTSPIKPAFNPGDENPAKPAFTQTYASLPLSFMGTNIEQIIASDQNPTLDLLDVKDDIRTIAHHRMGQVPWGWYQEGYDAEPTDSTAAPLNSTYIVHHNGPQYFGYVGDNPKEAAHLHGLADFFNDVGNTALPGPGGVFYVRGGYGNNDGLVPISPSPKVKVNFTGSDDHPGYADAQISEALLADEINAIASSPYWPESAIIVTYDESDGLYDHGPLSIRTFDPEGAPIEGAFRVPTFVISPFAKSHVIDHEYSEHSSVIRFIDQLYNLIPLANLPDELKGRFLGALQFGQAFIGPADAKYYGMGDLSNAFDNDRLIGNRPPLPASYAKIHPKIVASLPHYGGQGCAALGITPTDYVDGKLIDPPPADFNPRPGTNPGTPTAGKWPAN